LIRFLTAGESHGKGLIGILEGVPAGLEIEAPYIDAQLRRRQAGYGRSERMRMQDDRVEILSGVHHGKTTGAPITLIIENNPDNQWYHEPAPGGQSPLKTAAAPRPGHADLTGYLKYGLYNILDVSERASARETAIRVALGSVARKFLEECGIAIGSHVVRIGKIALTPSVHAQLFKKDIGKILARADASPVRCADRAVSLQMIRAIDKAIKKGDTLGGVIEILVDGLPVGLGSHTSWDKRISADLARYLVSVPGIKAFEIGEGFKSAEVYGSEAQDEIIFRNNRYRRKTNHAGGIEGGMTNGERLILRVAMKPIPTIGRPLRSVDLKTKKTVAAPVFRADICAVPAAGIVAEAMAALCLMNAWLEKYGGDSMSEILPRIKKS